MFDLNKIAPVELKANSHKSPSEGLCFMEMVAWFEGEKHSDEPECACFVLGKYGIGLNDRMPHNLRNELLRPLVPLMAGTRDIANEQKRAEFLAMWSVNKVLPIILRVRGFGDLAVRCELASDLIEARVAANAAVSAAYAAVSAAAYAANAAVSAANAATYAANAAAHAAAHAAAYAAGDAAYAAVDAEQIWRVAVEGLRQAILIGRHDGFSVMDFNERADALLELVA